MPGVQDSGPRAICWTPLQQTYITLCVTSKSEAVSTFLQAVSATNNRRYCRTMVTKLPNHWWASSCPTTSATVCLAAADDWAGSISRVVSRYVTRPQFSIAPTYMPSTVIKMMHGSECDIQIWWTWGWECHTRAQPSTKLLKKQCRYERLAVTSQLSLW